MDINLISKQIVFMGESETASLTGDTDDPVIHRLFLSAGQYNKLIAKVSALETH